MRLLSKTREMVFLSLLIAMAIVLSYFERFIPFSWNIPGMKLGLANVITIAAFYFFNKKKVFAIVVIRVVLTSLLVGSVMSFFYSLLGGLLSFIGMAIIHQFFYKWVSPIGISIVGAVLHNIGQLIVLTIVARSVTIAFSYAPFIIIAGVATGLFVGVTAGFFIRSIPIQQ